MGSAFQDLLLYTEGMENLQEVGMGKTAGRTVAIGIQDFGDLIRKGYFYVDKTDFIREWWESVTLITRPRRFGKTLNMSMVEHFFLWTAPGRESCLKDSRSGSMRGTTGFRGRIR